MPIELQIIRASEFVRVGPQGDFDFESSHFVLSQLAAACRRRGISRALLDLRALQSKRLPVFSPTELATLIDTFHRIGFSHQDRLAVLYTDDPHHRVRMFAFIGKLRGWLVRAFDDDFEQALTWLSDDAGTDVSTASNGQAERIPIAAISPGRSRPGKSKSRPTRRKRSQNAGRIGRNKGRIAERRTPATLGAKQKHL